MTDDSVTRVAAFIPNWIGDVAMCTPALRALRKRFPDAELIAAGRGGPIGLIRHIPWIDRTAVLPTKAGLSELFYVRQALNATDVAVVFPHSFRAALMARASGAKHVVGYARGGRSILLSKRVAPHRENGRIAPIYMADEYIELVKALGCEDDGEGLELHAPQEAVEIVRFKLKGDGPVVGFAPGAAFGPSKCWPVDRYAAVANELHDSHGAQCLLLTGPNEETTRNQFEAAVKVKPIVPHDGAPTIDSLLAAISQIDILIGNDSGPRHIAIAFKKPVVCIMGPTAPEYSCGPYEQGKVLRVDVDCGPCQKPTCATDHRCMTRIDTDWVTREARTILDST